MATEDIYQVSLNQSLYGVSCVNVFSYRLLTVGSAPTNAQDVADLFDTKALPEMAKAQSASLSYNCITVANQTDPGEALYQKTALSVDVGDLGTDSLPANAVAVLAFYGSEFSKKGRGRSFISGQPVLAEIDNCWESGHLTILINLAEFLAADLDDVAGTGAAAARVLFDPDPPGYWSLNFGTARPQVRKHRSRTTRRGCGV